MVPLNPYIIGRSVGKTDKFIGRADILREVNNVICHPYQNAITIFGQRRIGKTSLLHYLETNLPKWGKYIPIYFDLNTKANSPLNEILCDLAKEITSGLSLPNPSLGENPLDSFSQVFIPEIIRSLPLGSTLVLLLDELEVLSDPQTDKKIKYQFYGYLNKLLQFNTQSLKFVFVFGRNKSDLDIVTSRLLKDVPFCRISLLDQSDTETLIRLSEREGSLFWSTEAIEVIWKLTSGHPYLTQALCYQIWSDLFDSGSKTNLVAPTNVEQAIPGAIQRSDQTLKWIWKGLTYHERVTATAMASNDQKAMDISSLKHNLLASGTLIDIDVEQALQNLIEWDILRRSDDGYSFRVELFRHWIAENKPSWRLEDEIISDKFNVFNYVCLQYRRGKIETDSVIPLLKHILEQEPTFTEARLLLAEVFLREGMNKDAQYHLELLLKDNLKKNDLERVKNYLKEIYLLQADSDSIEYPEQKLEWLKKIETISPKDPIVQEKKRSVYLEIARRAEKDGDLEKAFNTYLEAGYTEKASDIIQKLIYKETYRNALEKMKSGEFETAKYLLEKIISYEKDNEMASFFLEQIERELNTAHFLPLRFNSFSKMSNGKQLKPLSPWNPIDYLLMLQWLLVSPIKFYVYNELYGTLFLCFFLRFIFLLYVLIIPLSLNFFGMLSPHLWIKSIPFYVMISILVTFMIIHEIKRIEKYNLEIETVTKLVGEFSKRRKREDGGRGGNYGRAHAQN